MTSKTEIFMDAQTLQNLIIAIRMCCADSRQGAGEPAAVQIVTFDDSAAAVQLASDEQSLEQRGEELDCGAVVLLDADASLECIKEVLHAAIEEAEGIPSLVAVAGVGLAAIGPSAAHTMAILAHFRGEHSEDLAALPLPQGRLAGKVAVITGSAQGFGKGIAEELAREGAHVVIADLNEQGAAQTAQQIGVQSRAGQAFSCTVDVTSLDSITASLAQTVKVFGGVDLFISNAGILKAGGLDEMDAASFELVTKVNYTAYFLCAKAAAVIMKQQHSYNDAHFMDIIQINSKSGLEGSNRNFAYAGGKFGSIGLTQSFALELVGYNIKVNAICPGNYFEGPLWSDPVRGLFVQYLNAGKVPGAQTVEDVKRFYMAKVPMNRGCWPRDVARAIMYAHEQAYETGQAIPVTGGQVMLN
jgi:NAD(P)-dependent dehydrogenase (short-subunit alcohol dehydrogenase family)